MINYIDGAKVNGEKWKISSGPGPHIKNFTLTEVPKRFKSVEYKKLNIYLKFQNMNMARCQFHMILWNWIKQYTKCYRMKIQ